jgi:hypothetical protein
MIRRLVICLPFLIYGCNNIDQDKSGTEHKLFSIVDSEASGVSFINMVEDQKDFNILNYRNFYNGGGVGIGDINNDGLQDLYFISNQDRNKLYLNKGNWKFEDITESAGVGGTKGWSTGVSFVDVNSDGFVDIYVCNSADLEGNDRQNELFMNNGDLTFTEEAEERGLNSNAFSVHAAFFDFDQDGDLDCYLLNNCFTTPEKMLYLSMEPRRGGEEGGDRLYENSDGFFRDISEAAGIHTGDAAFGLGVSVSDLNGDMLPDLYISNDFWERDYLYINQGGGRFIDEIENKIMMTSLNSMGADVGDLNNDGFPEIMATDMLPPDNYRLKTMTQFDGFRMTSMVFDSLFHHQIMQNALQLNREGKHFDEIAHIAGVSASDWSWGALILDLDLDGWKDIFISNGIQKDMTDFDFVDIIMNKEVVNQVVDESEGFDFRDFLPFLPETKISNSAYVNQRDMTFKESAMELGLDLPSFSNGSSYGDLDNDGDLDLVVNNANMEAFLFRNNTVESNQNNFLKISLKGPEKNPDGVGAKVQIYKGHQFQELQQFLSRGFKSSVAADLVFGLAKVEMVDSVRVIWPDLSMQTLNNIPSHQSLTLDYEDADLIWENTEMPIDPIFKEISKTSIIGNTRHEENSYNDFLFEGLTFKMLSTDGPRMLTGDVNGDELEDVILLGAADDMNKLFLQQKDGKLISRAVKGFTFDKHLEATCGAIFDFDQDGDNDILFGHGGNEIQKGRENFGLRLYENDGGGNFSINIQATPQVRGNFSCIVPGDIDNDGDMDLFIGARSVPGNYGLIPSSFFVLNNGNGTWVNNTTQELGTLGMVTSATWTDIDNDEDLDLMVVGDWMPITIFENTPGLLKKKGVIKDSHGWWSAIHATDLDEDGDDDYVLGNWGLNSKFKATVERPLSLYVKDFDRNGKVDQILAWYPPGEQRAFPFVSKDELVKQIPFLATKFETYKEYGNSTYEDLFDAEQRAGTLELKASRLESAILWRDENGFRLQALPMDAQLSPVFAVEVADVNHDSIKDIMLFGNHYGLKPEVGRLDANHGTLLLGDKNGNYQSVPQSASGLFVFGQVRDAQFILDSNGNRKLIITRNNDTALYYELKH